MAYEIVGTNVPEAYAFGCELIKYHGKREDTRNGAVLAMQQPTELTIYNPTQRVLFDKVRRANPFFHLMETVWMFAGSDHVGFIEKYNKRYRQYAEENGRVWGAYGHRWRKHFVMDQIPQMIHLLREDPKTRRCVIGMWDPSDDMVYANDLPCNTHIYFRVRNNALDMTVCNRSNDFVWGMLGANVVHMTYLQELMARGAGLKVGVYRVYTNNLHIYEDLPNYQSIIETEDSEDYYPQVCPQPLLVGNEMVADLFYDCEAFVNGDKKEVRTYWMKNVILPVNLLWETRDHNLITRITAPDWRLACRNWLSSEK